MVDPALLDLRDHVPQRLVGRADQLRALLPLLERLGEATLEKLVHPAQDRREGAAREALVLLVEETERDEVGRLELEGVVFLAASRLVGHEASIHANDLGRFLLEVVRLLGIEGEDLEGDLGLQEEQGRVLGDETPDIEKLEREMPYLDQVLDEVLRLYPPAWIGPRRAVNEFEFNGHVVPEGAYLNYCSWASHRIPEVLPEPEAFIPERFSRERKAALPRGAYVPFGGGRRICIGKRFGQTEVKLVATMLLQRLRLDAMPGRTMTVRQMPTLSPRGGLQMRVLPRQ